MNKFDRLNKKTNKKEAFIGVVGVIATFSETARPNKVSGKLYHQFTAKVETPKGEVTIGGQVYQALIPFLGGTPKVGERLNFAARVEDLQARQNAYWGISGAAIDAVSDDFLDAIGNL